jgi:hypothetical protein
MTGEHPVDTAWREFHIARRARDWYHFDQTLFATNGNVVFANFRASLAFTQKMNEKRDLMRFPEESVRAGQINAMGLIDEILHYVVARYRLQVKPNILQDALSWLDEKLGRETVDEVLHRFTDLFPPVAVYNRAAKVDKYLEDESSGVPNRQIAMEELLMLWLANMNPAFAPYLELFDDDELDKETSYAAVLEEIHSFFESCPPFGPDNENLVDMLRSPAIHVPHSLPGQLEYILSRWAFLLGKYFYRLLSGLDFIKEQEKTVFFGPGPALVPAYDVERGEPERFSPDRDWMPRVVLQAKNIYVWLDQLSRRYNRTITKLDGIPDEELDTLSRWGINGLWLIGLWERSRASKRIKQVCGNPEAVASAYSLFEYEIAEDLGGEMALENLRSRAMARGIRLASDMVPNHMGIDSKWLIEHPDWFVSLDHSPFPSYDFDGPDLSWNDRVGIFLENHYYDRSDAAVVFRRVDHDTENTVYVYHGNDGTSMPWNDTAQLNFLKPEVREAVIQCILHVARQFPIIRFDAAMTLTKRHYQRLWFPEPGSGGAIPSRAEHGLSRREFDAAVPEEFWREVVDRVADEVPDTLLLAEAFWLMEGYFVRTLGMHRVYNSAFMNMLRDEDNAGYRWVMKNTLKFDPEVLKRFVNFMNNPDEHTAVDQFGKSDKYFGICTMMVTLPGLPMFGHGQIEGFAEKYGMEYRRAYRDEFPDPHFIARHEREIFPLLHKRYLFAGVSDFVLYDFWTTGGEVNEDVFAYSNRYGGERALVIYHNKFDEARGWIRDSVGFLTRGADGSREVVRQVLGNALALNQQERYFTIFRDMVTGLEYIRRSGELCEKGLYIELDAYKYHVFLDVREVYDDEWRHYENLTRYLNGRGVPSIDDAVMEILLRPVHQPFLALVNADMFQRLMEGRITRTGILPDVSLADTVERGARELLRAIGEFVAGKGDEDTIAREMRAKMCAILQLPVYGDRNIRKYLRKGLDDDPAAWCTLFGWLCVHNLGKVLNEKEFEGPSRSWIDEWQFGRMLTGVLRDMGLNEQTAEYHVAVIKLLTAHQRWYANDHPPGIYEIFSSLFRDSDTQRILQVNRYQDILWYNKEAFEKLLWWLFVVVVIEGTARSPSLPVEEFRRYRKLLMKLQRASKASGYQVEKLLEGVRGQ